MRNINIRTFTLSRCSNAFPRNFALKYHFSTNLKCFFFFFIDISFFLSSHFWESCIFTYSFEILFIKYRSDKTYNNTTNNNNNNLKVLKINTKTYLKCIIVIKITLYIINIITLRFFLIKWRLILVWRKYSYLYIYRRQKWIRDRRVKSPHVLFTHLYPLC